MIRSVPNQPINFSASLMQGCSCDTLEPALIIDPSEDSILFQIGVGLCPDPTPLTEELDPVNDWKGSGFVIGEGIACPVSSLDNTGFYFQEQSFTPVPGQPYVLQFIVNEGMSGSMTVTVGGFTTVISAPGDYSFGFTASSTQQLTFTLDTPTSTACVQAVFVYAGATDIEVRIVQDGVDVFTIDVTNDPGYFTFEDASVTVAIPMTETGVTEGCFTIEVENPCDGITLISQTLNAVTSTCTLKIRACNDRDAMGFTSSFTPEIRLDAQLVRAGWDYDVSEERMSNGRISRPYADRQRVMELRIGLQSEWTHPFLSALPLFNHFYVGQEEFVMDADDWRPLYGDVFDGTGGIVRTVRPKQELLRNVQCAEENTAGCTPPPNFWVQGTGPNNDYILTQTGDRIIIDP